MTIFEGADSGHLWPMVVKEGLKRAKYPADLPLITKRRWLTRVNNIFAVTMMRRIPAYWWCQLLGWSTYCLVYTFFYLTIRTKPQPNFFPVLFIDAGYGFLITHFMRTLIKDWRLLAYPLQKQISYLFLTTIFFAFVYAYVSVITEVKFNLEPETMREYSVFNKTMRNSFGTFLFLLIWNLIYFTYHYVMKSRREQLDKMRLESTVKELQLKTIKAHINPHFIFNALNSIRALVDENPTRARTAITELSNILRSSMRADSTETTPLEKELNIVKDYLALEHIRFEDRLKVEYDIDEDTLDQQVPPMMLQTLVENAIKHGISKRLEGGVVKIISDFKDDYHELIVQNTGLLQDTSNPEGFGLVSTKNRINLVYGSKASFEIRSVNPELVEARVKIPLQTA